MPLDSGRAPHVPRRIQGRNFLARGERVGSSAAELVINCPVTNKPVSTGLRAEWVIFKSLPPVAVPLQCPACGSVHKWTPDDAWIGS